MTLDGDRSIHRFSSKTDCSKVSKPPHGAKRAGVVKVSQELSSDHYPVVVDISFSQQSQPAERRLVNHPFDWTRYSERVTTQSLVASSINYFVCWIVELQT